MIAALVLTRWRGRQFERRIDRLMADRLGDASAAVADRVRDNIDDPSPPPSDPGEFPRRRSGELHGGIRWDVDRRRLRGHVISDAEHTLALEKGTQNMAARPFMWRSLMQMRQEILRIIGRPM